MSHLLSIVANKFYLYLRVSSLLLSLNDASGDLANDEGSFQFSPEAEFTLPLYVHITLAADTEAESPCSSKLLQCQKHVEILSI